MARGRKIDPRLCKGTSRCEKPRMNDGFRSWVTCFLTLRDGEVIDGYLGDKWGEYLYFELDDSWRRIKLDKLVDTNQPGSAILRYDLNNTAQ